MINKMDSPEQFLKDFQAIFSPDDTGFMDKIDKTKKLTTIFDRAFEIDSNKTSSIIASFILGTHDNRDLEDRRSYDSFTSHHIATLNYLSTAKIDSNFNKHTFASMLIEDFRRAFELDIKILIRLVCIDRFINGQAFDIDSLYFESAGGLINRLNQSSIDWRFITKSLDKRIRNSSSHLDFDFDFNKGKFIGKDKNSRTKTINRFEITPEEMLITIMPGQTNIIQSFIAAGILLCLKPYPTFYNKAIAWIN